ncbi:hypothetical protein [Saccharopolyspora sp. NPDC002376]
MRRNFHFAWKGSIAGLLAVGMMFTGGCGGSSLEPYPMPTFSDGTTAINPPRPSGPPPGPVKYAFASFKTCQEIQQEIPGLPPSLDPQRSDGSDPYRFSQACTFTENKDDGPLIGFRVELWENRQDEFGSYSGADLAKSGSGADVPLGGEWDSSVGIGSEARWTAPGSSDSCELLVRDENALMITYYDHRIGDNDSQTEQCRAGARDVARRIFAAVQPL